MTFDTFLSILTEAKIDTDPYLPFSLDAHYRYAREAKPTPEKVPMLIQHWETGGASGGSCWGDEPEEYSTSDGPGDFTELDKALKLVCPTITYLQYRELCGSVKEGSAVDYEYYGNRTDYGYQLITVRTLFDKLVEMGLLS